MKQEPKPAVGPSALAQDFATQLEAVAKQQGVSLNGLNKAGLGDFLRQKAPKHSDARSLARAALLELSQAQTGEWEPIAREVVMSVIAYLSELGFTKPAKERFAEIKAMLEQKANQPKLEAWFDTVFPAR